MNESQAGFIHSTPKDSPGFLLWKVTNLWQREIRKILKPHKLTHTQFVLLASMYWHHINGDEITQSVLSKKTHVDPMTTSSVIKALEGKKIVTRKKSVQDAREFRLSITKGGLLLIQRCLPIVEQFDDSFFAFSKKDLKSFTVTLNQLLND